jgi:preprotein translocase subunit SecD
MFVRGQLDEPQISFIMRPEAAAAFGKVTSENIGRGLAIILDGKLYSAPRIQSPITTGNAQISGQFTMEEAFTLAAAMDTPLPLSVKVVESRTY